MRKAKVKDGVVQHVWPFTKTLWDGTVVRKELPHHYATYEAKMGEPHPAIVDVPDEVRQGWVWNEEKKAFAPRVKAMPSHEEKYADRPEPASELVDVLAERLGFDKSALMKEVMRRKQEKAAKKAAERREKKLAWLAENPRPVHGSGTRHD